MRLTVLNVAYPLARVSPQTAGGAEQVLLQLDRALVEYGHRSLVVACEGSEVAGTLVGTPRPPQLLDEAAKRAARRHHLRAIAGAMREHRIDVVHLHGIDFHACLPPSGPPVLVTLHLPLAWYPREALRPDRPNTYLHCVSSAQHRTAPPDVGLLRPIENGVAVGDAPLPEKRNFALFLGRICPEKGVHLAVVAAERAQVPLLIAGETFAYPEHIRYFESQIAPKLGQNCRFIGPVGPRRKQYLLAKACCVLLPSLAEETSSLVAREAMAAGTPPIAFPNGAMADVLVHGRTGFLARGVEEMAQAIAQAPSIDPELCRAETRRRFPLSKMLDTYLSLYASLAGATVREAVA